MAEKPAPKPVERVEVVGPYGERGSVDAGDLDKVIKGGGRALTAEELAQKRLDDEYAKTSAVEKVAGGITTATGALNPLMMSGARGSQAEAYNRGVVGGLSAGLAPGAARQAVDAIGGKKAGDAFEQHERDLATAYSKTHFAGEMMGMAAGSALGGKSGPVGAINAAGEAVGGLASRGLAGLASRGVLGRAAASAGELGLRGGVEGLLYGAANQVGEDLLGDRELAADKVFASAGLGALMGAAGGAVLGGGGSLAKSGAIAALTGARSGLARVMSSGKGLAAKAEAAVVEGEAKAAQAAQGARDLAEGAAAKATREAADEASKAAKFVAEQTGTKPAQEIAAARNILSELGTAEGQKGLAHDFAWNQIAKGNGFTPTRFAKQAEKYLPNGTRDVGEVLMRKGIINADDGLMAGMRNAAPEVMADRIATAREAVGQQIGAITDASGARVQGASIVQAVEDIASRYEASAATRPAGRSVRTFGAELADSLGLKNFGDTVSVQDLLRERKAIDRIVFGDATTMDPKLALELKRELRGRLEGVITDALDDASGKVPGELKAQYKALKKDFLALSIAEDITADSAARVSQGATLGLRDMIFGAGSGGGITGLASSFGHKVFRERGNAAAAVLLHRMADMGTITRAVASVDEVMGKAAKGLISPPIKGPLPEPVPKTPPRLRAQTALSQVAKFQADPDGFIDTVTRNTEAMSISAPEVAGGVAKRMTDAVAFLASKAPVQPDKDPLDPHPAPRMSESQAAEFARYAWYTERPARFFEEAAHGKLTYEGAETAKALMPKAFAQLQARMLDEIATTLASGGHIPYVQRLRIGAVMDIPADPSQRLEHMLFLQRNVASAKPSNDATVPTNGPSAPRRPLPNKTQQSTLDRLEGK